MAYAAIQSASLGAETGRFLDARATIIAAKHHRCDEARGDLVLEAPIRANSR